ncbi:MAG: hypothetical protein HYZ42_12575 [Bacteroidetes bacterium]|nr:hypothetical protein [Bacteroidota bacterium]
MKYIQLFPKTNYTIKTTLSIEEVKLRLMNGTEAPNYNHTYHPFSKHKSFQSYISRDSFEIYRVFEKPTEGSIACIGEFKELDHGCEINLDFNHPQMMKVISILIYIISILFLGYFIFTASGLFIVTLGVIPIVYKVNWGYFEDELYRYENFLNKVLKVE